ncbi:anthranilate synthase component II [Nosocomiicoccus ampullae]|uniref:Anthranilate synthase/aminodeoxychorismate synthase-like glutamine amidotransferase n=1 Tax=Nosocomiicoccus ampullae TaxID=489910 RepID=A0A9Q2CYV2_9STAP|nr:aminodeoxychorismate/anthranilate synthase component II [Nosocomiicoccus ampullae]MBB5175698.1 anthranilate synthase/aminodeoxychorismate synthase-like glutamine amidotransferase [Nosocomiicoccus ampullae]QYA47091.1 aminodeoxychorismate/anthranilate synthase component II [Nosocomiicoccus ampullae]
MNLLMIDNYDSFTYNLVHYLQANKKDVNVIVKQPHELYNDIIDEKSIIGVVVSPGPSHPKDRPEVIDFLREIWGETPIFGICLGHQMLWHMTGGEVSHLNRPVHGETYTLTHDETYIFNNIKNNIDITRYHSLVCKGENDEFLIAGTADDEIMAIRHKEYDIFGVQYHPESILSEFGHEQINNFINIALERY